MAWSVYRNGYPIADGYFLTKKEAEERAKYERRMADSSALHGKWGRKPKIEVRKAKHLVNNPRKMIPAFVTPDGRVLMDRKKLAKANPSFAEGNEIIKAARAGQATSLKHPERTAYRSGSGMNFDITFKTWTNRPAMARSIRMQERRGFRSGDWKAVIPLGITEGY